MPIELRRRVVVLQITLVVVLAFVAGFLYWASDFTHSYVHDQLTQQRISFPAAGSPALKQSEFPDLQQYAGQAVNDGDKARAYANGFIGRHLQAIGGGKTYSQVSALAQANPKNQALAGEVQTLFRGETLRGLLLNAWGWWTVGTYALYAAIGLTVAAVAVFLAFLYEVLLSPKRVIPGAPRRAA
ncbi:MAG TPA: hypothetical protein VN837_04925 [Chloroflexota bacterium]|nr:hypothetical protein [Chloroflexota bacterium]